jgi:hypothetical protein
MWEAKSYYVIILFTAKIPLPLNNSSTSDPFVVRSSKSTFASSELLFSVDALTNNTADAISPASKAVYVGFAVNNIIT